MDADKIIAALSTKNWVLLDPEDPLFLLVTLFREVQKETLAQLTKVVADATERSVVASTAAEAAARAKAEFIVSQAGEWAGARSGRLAIWSCRAFRPRSKLPTIPLGPLRGGQAGPHGLRLSLDWGLWRLSRALCWCWLNDNHCHRAHDVRLAGPRPPQPYQSVAGCERGLDQLMRAGHELLKDVPGFRAWCVPDGPALVS